MISYLPAALMALPLFSALLAVEIIKKRNSKFINPLTGSLARPPGAQLGRELSNEHLEYGAGIADLLYPSCVPIVIFLSFKEKVMRGDVPSLVVLAVALLVWFIWSMSAIRKLIRRVERIRVLRLAYECEIAVGQELDLLMLSGYRVFHDIQAGKFNIDHLVIGESGIFAVETKGRSKRMDKDGNGKKGYRVVYESGVLKFPDWQDRESIEQATRQAAWTSKWLSGATGLSVPVRPVVVLPGWYIENKDRPVVPVIASGYIQKYFQSQRGPVFSNEELQRVVHQVDQKVRDLAPGEIGRPLPEPS